RRWFAVPWSLSTQPRGRVLNRFHDVDVAGAAAQVAGDRLPNFGLGRVRVASQEGDARHHHPRRAVAALQAVLLPEAFLDRMELAAFFQSLDRADGAAVGLYRQHGARLDRFAVDDHRAGAAVRGVAADVRAGQTQLIAQQVD